MIRNFLRNLGIQAAVSCGIGAALYLIYRFVKQGLE